MLERFKKLSDTVDTISLIIAGLMVLAILCITIYGTFFRYVLNDPLPWPLTFGRILMIWSALIGIAAALKRGQHMGVEGIIRLFPRRLEVIVRYTGHIFVLFFVIVVFWFGLQETLDTRDMYMLTARTRISARWLSAAIPFSAFIQFIHLLAAPYVIEEIMSKDLTETDIKTKI